MVPERGGTRPGWTRGQGNFLSVKRARFYPLPRSQWRAMRSRPDINRPLASGTLRPESSNTILHGRDLVMGKDTDLGTEVRISAVVVGYTRQLD